MSGVPPSTPVKLAFAALVGLAVLGGGIEIYMLARPETVAPFSWAFWFLGERAPWLFVVFAGLAGSFASHFGWYLRPTRRGRRSSFWKPLSRWKALIISSTTLVSLAAVQAWDLLVLAASFLVGVVLAHRYWYRIEDFREHVGQFHDPEEIPSKSSRKK